MPRHKSRAKHLTRSTRSRMFQFALWVVRHGETMENRNNIYQGHSDTVLSDEGIRQAQMVAKRLQDIKFAHIYSSDLQRAYKTAEHILQINKFKDGLEVVQDARVKEKGYGILEGKTKSDLQALLKNVEDSKNFVPEGGESVHQLYARTVEFLEELCLKLVQTQQKKKKKETDVRNSEENVEFLEEADIVCHSKSGVSFQESLLTKETTATSDSAANATNSQPIANILLVIHGGTIRQLTQHFARKVPSEFYGVSKRRIGGLSPNTGVSRFEICVDEASADIALVRCTMLFDASHLEGNPQELDNDRAL